MIPRPPFLKLQRQLARDLASWGLTVFFGCVALAVFWLLFVFAFAQWGPRP